MIMGSLWFSFGKLIGKTYINRQNDIRANIEIELTIDQLPTFRWWCNKTKNFIQINYFLCSLINATFGL